MHSPADKRQVREGGSGHVRVSLAQTGRWLWNLGRLESGLNSPDLPTETVHAAFIESMQSGFGTLKAVQHSARLRNAGVSEPSGDAARQSSGGVAGAKLT